MNWKLDVSIAVAKGVASVATVSAIICLFLLFTCGCVESEQPPVWGNGDPPASWQETFGNDNIARVNFVQMRMFKQMDARIKVIEEFCRIDNGNNPNKTK